jgi:hypothetical protein
MVAAHSARRENAMRWPEASSLIEQIRWERPELTADDHPLSRLMPGGYRLPVYCCVKVNEEEDLS